MRSLTTRSVILDITEIVEIGLQLERFSLPRKGFLRGDDGALKLRGEFTISKTKIYDVIDDVCKKVGPVLEQ